MPFLFKPVSEIPGLVVIEPKVFSDDRGWFMETFKKSEWESFGLPTDFVQTSQSKSLRRGTIRGLHFQNDPFAQGKLVRCIRGEIFDVAVDLRRGSPSYGKWKSMALTEESRIIFWVPAGFAHGFCAITDGAEVDYFQTCEWSKENEHCIVWSDPDLNIPWPAQNPIVSPKDASGRLFKDSDHNFVWKGGNN
ncbi:MAG: dTDP-4-dehydrorhamnose 3,5-epimerase [Candidatus Doudnabacteria bacterium]|nr:dTDP-4-dehydrorhamnose 3,5-epimerase [Candidatus Doudnabacteria bacterium]